MSPERPGSPHDEGVYTPKMSVPASPVAGTPIREAQSPISILLEVAIQNRTADDDLTSLSWLQDRDLLKGMNFNPSPSNSLNSTPVKYNNNNNILTDQYPTSDYIDDSSISAPESTSSSVHSPVPYQTPSSAPATNTNGNTNNNQQMQQQRNKHPHNIPYNPLIHTNNKPPYSFSCLIFMAIEDSIQKALPVKEIYAWILDHFPYFKNAPTGWKNSVRHNLSLNKCFQKLDKVPNLGKGSLWTVDEQYKPNLIQALTRSPFHPCSTLDPAMYFSNKPQITPEKNSAIRLPNPELFPYLARKMAGEQLNGNNRHEASDSESLDTVDAAAVMLSLKNGPRLNVTNHNKKEKSWQIITTSPSQDHTYSAADNVDLAGVDEAFESDDERACLVDRIRVPKTRTCRKIDFEDDEERKQKEGAETLLNLAGIATRKRHNSNGFDYETYKTIKLSHEFDSLEEQDEKPAPFKPRLLRTKKKDAKMFTSPNNNNDEWVKHRRELEINQTSDSSSEVEDYPSDSPSEDSASD